MRRCRDLTRRFTNDNLSCGGGTLGSNNLKCEMILYNGVNDHFAVNDHFLISYANKDKCSAEYLNLMKLYHAGTDFCANRDDKYEMNFYAAATIGDCDKSVILKKNIHSGLRNRLLSYADVDLVKGAFSFWLSPSLREKKLFIDSGAFSAFTRGVKIDIKEYCEWLKINLKEIEVYANLDVIGDWKSSAKNQAFMESQGLKPLPTFHYQSPLNELERICKQYSYFALGGLVPLSKKRPTLMAWLDKCFAVIKKQWPKKIHCLGITAQPILERYPFYSCDSTAAIMGGGMGRVMNFEQGKLSHSDWVTELKEGVYQTADKDGKSGHLDRRIHNIEQMVAFERHITDLWTRRGITWND